MSNTIASNLSTSSSLEAMLSSESKLILPSPREELDEELWAIDAGAEALRLTGVGAAMADAFPPGDGNAFRLISISVSFKSQTADLFSLSVSGRPCCWCSGCCYYWQKKLLRTILWNFSHSSSFSCSLLLSSAQRSCYCYCYY